MDSGRTYGGTLRLLELIEAHPAEITYDFRSRFQIGLEEIGDRISYLEAIYLASVLLRDPSSWLQAAVNDWKFPVSREWQVSVHTYDLHAAVNSKNKPKPYPTPWPEDGTQKIGSTRNKTREDVLKQLAKMNPEKRDDAS